MLIGYIRASLSDGTYEKQKEMLSQAGCQEIFVDRCYARDPYRPNFVKALQQARAGDVVLAWKLDRIALSTRHAIELLTMFRGRGVGIKLLTGQIDTFGQNAEVILGLARDLEELETDLAADRSTSDIVATRIRRRQIGRANRRSLSSDQIFEAISMLTERKLKLQEVAARLGVPRATLVRYVDAKGNALPPAAKILALKTSDTPT